MHTLKILSNGTYGTKFYLDDFEIKSVIGYELKGIDSNTSELSIKIIVSNADMLVDYSRDNIGQGGIQ